MDTLSLLFDDIHQHGAEFLFIEAAPPWAVRLGSVEGAAFHVVLGGSAWLHQEGESPIELKSGQVLMLPKRGPHQLQSMPEKSSVAHDISLDVSNPAKGELKLPGGGGGSSSYLMSGYFHFDSELAKPLMQALPPIIILGSENGEMRPWMRLGTAFIADELSERRPAQQAVLNRIADCLFIEIMRDYLDTLPVAGEPLPNSGGGGSWLLALRDPALSAALSAIHANPERDWTVTQLAERAHLSRSAFAERFRKIMGITPLAYMTAHRMRLACWQLSQTKQPIISIAESVGYSSDTAFSQAFKRERGCTPSEFRRRAGLEATSLNH